MMLKKQLYLEINDAAYTRAHDKPGGRGCRPEGVAHRLTVPQGLVR